MHVEVIRTIRTLFVLSTVCFVFLLICCPLGFCFKTATCTFHMTRLSLTVGDLCTISLVKIDCSTRFMVNVGQNSRELLQELFALMPQSDL